MLRMATDFGWIRRIPWPTKMLILSTLYLAGSLYFGQPILKFSSEIVNHAASYLIFAPVLALLVLALRPRSIWAKAGSVVGVVVIFLVGVGMTLWYTLGEDIEFTESSLAIGKSRVIPIIALVGTPSSGPWYVRINHERPILPGVLLVRQYRRFGEFTGPISTPSLSLSQGDTVILDLVPAPSEGWKPVPVHLKPWVYF